MTNYFDMGTFWLWDILQFRQTQHDDKYTSVLLLKLVRCENMNRKKHELNNVRIADEEYGRLENKFDLLRNEVNRKFDG